MRKLVNVAIIVLIVGALATTNNKETKEQFKIDYNSKEYAKYLEYKSNLIEKYGYDVYILMNQEAGIETEQDSFNHFMKYGI